MSNVTLRLFPNAPIPNHTNPDTSISRMHVSQLHELGPSSLGRMIRDTPFGSGMDNQIRDCGIQEINVVGIMMFGIGSFGIET